MSVIIIVSTWLVQGCDAQTEFATNCTIESPADYRAKAEVEFQFVDEFRVLPFVTPLTRQSR